MCQCWFSTLTSIFWSRNYHITVFLMILKEVIFHTSSPDISDKKTNFQECFVLTTKKGGKFENYSAMRLLLAVPIKLYWDCQECFQAIPIQVKNKLTMRVLLAVPVKLYWRCQECFQAIPLQISNDFIVGNTNNIQGSSK